MGTWRFSELLSVITDVFLGKWMLGYNYSVCIILFICRLRRQAKCSYKWVCREYTTYVNFGRKEMRAQSSLIQGEKIKIDGYLHRSGCTCDVYNVSCKLGGKIISICLYPCGFDASA